MATVTITNTQAQPANIGQGVLVTSTSSNGFDNIAVGQICTLDSNNKQGEIVWIDKLNNQFKIQPHYPYTNLASYNNPNLFSAQEDVIVTIS
jgi:hypothetical protein